MTKREPLPVHFTFALAAGLVTGLLAGCGQFKMPEATTPPEWAVVGQRAPAFSVFAEDPFLPGKLHEVGSKDFEGRVLVAIGALPGFVGEFIPWLKLLERHYGPPRGRAAARGAGEEETSRYSVLLIAERGPKKWADRISSSTLAKLQKSMRDGPAMHIDPVRDFVDNRETDKSKFGFVGEGPHVAVIAADGTLLAVIDGPVSEKRSRRLVEAMDRAFSLPGKKPPEKPATPVDEPATPLD